MANEITIPLLPCHSINEVLAFYIALGFDVTYQQEKPNNYAVVQWENIELHFFSMREYIPANSYSTCYVRVTDVDDLYKALTGNLRQAYGRVPSAGIPRVIPLKNKSGRREFIIVDTGGNWIRIGQVMPNGAAEKPSKKAGSTPLSRAMNAAELMADHKGDYAAAAKMLDAALAKDKGSAVERVQALVMQAGYSITMGDYASAKRLLEAIRAIELTADERVQLAEILQTADDLEQQLS